MRVAITGAGGFLGTAMTRAFLADGYKVRAADLARADLSVHRELGAETSECDVTRSEHLEAVLDGVDIVVHAAGIFDFTAPDELLWAVNADSVRLVCEAAASQGVKRMVHISSSGVYGRCGLGVAEDHPKVPVMSYERSKWDGEQIAWDRSASLGLPLTVLRPTLIYGGGSRYGLAPAIALFALRKARGLPTLPVATGGPVGHLVHVDDVAAAAVLLARSDKALGRAFNAADDTPVHAGDLIRALADATGVNARGMALPWFVARLYPLLRPMIRGFVVRENRRIAASWARLVEREELESALSPRLDLDFFDYMLANHSYDTSALKGLGFECKYADPYKGIALTGDWYRAHRWLPPLAAT